MATYTIYKLTFTAPLHLSRGKEDTYESSESTLHSDTLKSAIYVAALQLGMKDWADKFMQETRISSAFPFDEFGCYLPMPLSYHPNVKVEERKEFKKIKYLTIKQFEAISKGDLTSPLIEGKAVQPDVWMRDITQRVKVNYEADSTPFYLEKLYPKEGAGLYFLVENEEDKAKLDAAIKFLSETGIGLQRNLGNGRFEAKSDTLEIATTPSNAFMNLSLYHPANDKELSDDVLKNGTYQFKKRGGWLSSPELEDNLSLRKKGIMMFSEGSVFPFDNPNDKGCVKNVKPDTARISHEIWRDGKAIFLPVKTKNE
jgi:CRISPR-associated protein Csm4